MANKTWLIISFFFFTINTALCQDYFELSDYLTNEDIKEINNTESYKFTASLGGGISFVNGSNTTNLHYDDVEFLKQLKFGFNANGDILYHINSNSAVGFKYSHFFSDAGLSIISIDQDSISIYSHLETNFRVGLVSPYYRYTHSFSEYSNLCIDIGAGFLFANEIINLRSDIQSSKLEENKNRVGIFAGLAYELWIQDFWALALRMNVITGVPSNFEHSYINQIIKRDAIKLSRIDLGLEIRFVL